MPFPILAEADLPAVGTTCERSDVDFKIGVNPKDEIELAKDVGALANTVGGSVVIGAATQGSQLTGYPGLAASVASAIPDAYEKAAKDRCRPAPKLASQVITLAANNATVVVINVWPAALAPIGISISQQLSGARLVDYGWAFPFRVGSHTRFLQPDQFGMLENVSARRAAALLLGIPQSEKHQIRLSYVQRMSKDSISTMSHHDWVGQFEDVALDKNVAHFKIGSNPGGALQDLRVPLDWIDTVWRDDALNRWEVTINAVLRNDGGRWVAAPRLP